MRVNICGISRESSYSLVDQTQKRNDIRHCLIQIECGCTKRIFFSCWEIWISIKLHCILYIRKGKIHFHLYWERKGWGYILRIATVTTTWAQHAYNIFFYEISNAKKLTENLVIILIMGSQMSLNLDIGGIYKKIIYSKLLLMMESFLFWV